MRIFIAITLPEKITAALTLLQRHLKAARAEVAWTRAENHHLTLRFIGEVAEAQIAHIKAACQHAGHAVPTFTLSVCDTGAFPNLRQPRVLWAGLHGDMTALRQLQANLEMQLVPAGFPAEERPFKPHLTIGRVRTQKNIAPLITRLTNYQLPPLTFPVRELVVMQSQLQAGGSIYTPQAIIPLADAT